MTSIVRRLWKWIAAFCAAVLILLAVGVGLFRVAVSQVPALRDDAEQFAERVLGMPARIGEIDLRWTWGPELVLKDVQLLSPEDGRPVGSATRLEIGFGPLDLFQDDFIRPSHVRVHEPTLALERENGQFFLSGYALPRGEGARLEWREVLDRALRHGRVTIIDGRFHYRDPARCIEEWQLDIERLSAASDGRRHEFEGSLRPPGALGQALKVSFEAEGPAARPEDWQWRLQLEGRELQLAWWHQQFPWTESAYLEGAVTLAVDVAGRGVERFEGGGRFEARGFDIAGSSPDRPRLATLAFDWMAVRDEAATRVEVPQLDIEFQARPAVQGRGIAIEAGDAGKFELRAEALPLDALAPLARLLPIAQHESLEQARALALELAPRGGVRNLWLAVDRPARRFQLRGEFEAVGVDPYGKVPGVEGISGRISGNEDEGEIVLAAQDVRIDTDGLFRDRLPVALIDATLRWQRDDQGMRISGEGLRVENPEARALASLVLELPKDGEPVIDLRAELRDIDFMARSTWLPVRIMPETLIEWLDTAITAGGAAEAQALLQGPLRHFPFRDGSGTFDIRFRAENVAVKFAPDWPAAENLVADVHFDGPGLGIRVHQAGFPQGISVHGGVARFRDLADAHLELEAGVQGDAADMLRFLEASALAEPLDGLLRTVEARGPVSATVELDLPITDIQDTRLRVDAQLDGVDARISALPWPAEDLRGQLTITERTASSRRLQGRFHGQPLALSIVPEATPGEGFATTRINLDGRSPVERFDDYLPPAWLARLQGTFPWTAAVRIPGNGEVITIGLGSTLEGLRSSLPEPLARLGRIEARLTLTDAERIDAEVSMEGKGSARLRFVERPSGWAFDRGAVRHGGEAGDLPMETGLIISGETPRLDVSGWLELATEEGGTAAAGGQGGEDNSPLRAFDVRAGTALFAGLPLEDQRLRGSRRANAWEIQLEGPATGSIVAPLGNDARRPLELRLRQLHLPEPPSPDAEGEGEAASAPDPRRMPRVEIGIDDFRFGAIHLGAVSGTLERTAIGFTTENLVAQSPVFRIALSGRWEYIQGGHYTSVVSELTSTDLNATLARLGYQGALDASSARIRTSVAWQGPPNGFDRRLLEGAMNIHIEDGVLREVGPGAGRLLGLLSLTALPRRLLLDFSDFLGEGLHFDTLAGDFLITGGNAYTTNVRLQGPSLSALLVGRTGLAARDYDQLAIITPGVSASIPVAGYLAAGPQVGAALLLLSQLLKSPLEDITQVKYRITGSWDEPVIEKVIQERNAEQNSN